MRVRISRSLLGDITAAAAAEPAREICGLLFGSTTLIEEWQQTANVADDPERRFEIDPVSLFAAFRAERGGGTPLVGYVHSHPSGEATPSPTDAASAARDGRLWLIVAPGDVRLWRSGPCGFEPVAIDAS